MKRWWTLQSSWNINLLDWRVGVLIEHGAHVDEIVFVVVQVPCVRLCVSAHRPEVTGE